MSGLMKFLIAIVVLFAVVIAGLFFIAQSVDPNPRLEDKVLPDETFPD